MERAVPLETARLPLVAVVAIAAAAAVAALVALVFLCALPKPLPGIPYNKHAARRLLGDVDDMRRATSRRQWIWSQPGVHGAPISQLFLFPLRSPTVVVSDYRTAVDICSRRVKEFDRGSRNRECVGLTAPNFHFTMQSSDPRLRRQREMLRDLMTPWFLSQVAAPRIYDSVSLLVKLWSLKQAKAGSRPFPAARDLSMATLDMISSAAFGMEKSKAALSKEVECVWGFNSENDSEVVDFPRAAKDVEVEGLLDMADMIAIAQGSAFPRLAQWLAMLKPRHARAHWHRRRLLRRQTAKSLERLARVGDDGVPESALDELLRRERRAATPDFWSPAVRDELLGYLLGGHETSAATLAWWVKQITRHQDVQARLREALFDAHAEAVADGRWPTMAEIVSVSVPFLDAVLEESLRCASVAALIVRQAKCDTQILGHSIPRGTDIIISLTGPSLTEPALAIPESLRSEACQKAKDRVPAWGGDVDVFKPERWLKRERGETVFDPLAGPNLAFSCGPRSCFGRKQAHLQLKTTMTLLIWNFAFEPIDSALDGWEVRESLVNVPKTCLVRLAKP